MGRHKIWRNLVKKIRRKRLRQLRAQERDAVLEAARNIQELSPSYQAWTKEQEALEQFREEEEARLSEERNKEWVLAEVEAQHLWRVRQERAEKAKKEKQETELRIRKEWEAEQQKLELVEMEKKKEQEEKLRKQEELMKQIVEFVEKGGERPAFADDINETNPNRPLCPFFTKTGACRFGDRCSRNHPRPALSKTVLLPNFYSHFGMDQSMLDEYDSDLLLEYEDSETYQHFREFYCDVVPELFRYGQPVAVVICRNSEPHLRGNVYVEYGKEAEAAKAVTSLNGRWYGGKLISAQFTSIPTWKAAICGLFHRGKCPKGKACNFLHTFHNPAGEFSNPDREREKLARRQRNAIDKAEPFDRDLSERSSQRGEDRRGRSDRRRDRMTSREWRWSESPERAAFPKDTGEEVEREEKSLHGNSGRSPESMSRERRKSHRSSGERREVYRERRRRRGSEEARRKSRRRSHDNDREEKNRSSQRERSSRGNEKFRGKEDETKRDRSRDKHKHRSRPSQERNGVESDESKNYGHDKGNERGVAKSGDEEMDDVDHSVRVQDGDGVDASDSNC